MTDFLLFHDLFFTTAVFFTLFILLFWVAERFGLRMSGWFGGIGLLGLGGLRLAGYGDVNEWNIDAIESWLLIVSAAVIAAITIHIWSKSKITIPSSFSFGIWFDIGVGVLLLGLVGWLTLPTLSDQNFQNDEYFQVEAAKGYLETGEFYRWDFTTDQVRIKNDEPSLYARAWPHTWQIAQSFRLFGVSEWSARLPSVIWFAVFILLVYFLVSRWMKDKLFAALLAFMFVFFDHFIVWAQTARMYSMFLPIATVAIASWYKAYTFSLRASWWKSIGMISAAGLVSIFAILVHKIFFFFFPAFFIFLLFEGVRTIKTESPEVYRAWLWILGGGLGGVLLYLLQPSELVSGLSYIGLRKFSFTLFELWSVIDFPIVALALVCFIAGTGLSMFGGRSIRYASLITLPVILIFVVFAERWGVPRYISFVFPLVGYVVARTLYTLLMHLTVSLSKKMQFVIIVGVFGLLLIPFRGPEIPDPIERKRIANYELAYGFIQKHKSPGDVVFPQLFRPYYWGVDNETNIIKLPTGQRLSKVEMTDLMNTYEQGWIVWKKTDAHMRGTTHAYISNNAKAWHIEAPELWSANMYVYYFDATTRK